MAVEMREIGYDPILIVGRKVGPNSEMNLQLTTENCCFCNVLLMALRSQLLCFFFR